jgi:hypothetical protein
MQEWGGVMQQSVKLANGNWSEDLPEGNLPTSTIIEYNGLCNSGVSVFVSYGPLSCVLFYLGGGEGVAKWVESSVYVKGYCSLSAL